MAILVASPLGKGLFQRAIAESGNDALPLAPSENAHFDRAAAEAKGMAFAKAAAAHHLSDLRAMSLETLAKQPWSPVPIVDGHVLHEDLTTTYQNHRQNDVPILVGWNAEEGKDLAPEILGTRDFTAANHRDLMARLLGHAPTDALLKTYPGANDAQARAAINQLTNDWWGWRMQYWANLQRRNSHSKSYVYFFAHRPAELPDCGYGCGIGHGAEIQYVFDHLDWEQRPWTAEDRQLATELSDRWVAFAATGDPNRTSLPVWPVFDGSNASIFRIGGDKERPPYERLPDFDLFVP
ncbi:hypothetical protein ABENE_18095 [Asticcacaulis benevestitus DSM 16100 = ATCC BAA-896]|uniref:Carboxylesterase type B domain-containing protein n=1 Tax=Asticcacaulis benevestitus DSM 16100 = ATCC BAA-896 TaxID=1121022 RepID=V4R585_9CAUL|nr:hypothetical protein ABENE_18095 [Asticcacaulis benevestitus DSM 16100 = ATCC BAA-896]